MTQVNTCLKLVFTIFNIFLAIVGALIIGLALLCQIAVSRQIGASVQGPFITLYIIGAITMVIAILGVYGAHRESRMSMIIFLVCMMVSSLLVLKTGVPYAIARPQIEAVMKEKLRPFVPLDQASPDDQKVANAVQTEVHCCGLFNYSDWRGNIPDSCVCSREEEEQGLCQTVTDKRFGEKSIYAEPCFPTILHYTQLLHDMVLGVAFSLLVPVLLGMILSFIIIHQMRYHNRPTIMMTVPPIFTTAPPQYQELHNRPGY